MTAAQRERSALVSTFRQVGPDAPTLCAGWTTRDLAAHLVVRERRLDATPGITVPFLAGYTAKVQNKVAQSTDWDDLVELVSSGPPIYSPFKLLDLGRQSRRDVHPSRGRAPSHRRLAAQSARRIDRHAAAPSARVDEPA